MAGRYIPLGYAEAGIISAAIAGKAAQARFEYGGYNYPYSGGDTKDRTGTGTGGAASAGAPPPVPSPRNLGAEDE